MNEEDVSVPRKGSSGRRDMLRMAFQAAVDAADPEAAVRKHVDLQGNRLNIGGRSYVLDDYARVLLVGAGKASAPMAKAMEDILGDRLSAGLVVVKYGHGLPLRGTRIIEAGHPMPDEAGLRGAAAVIELLEGCTANDLVIAVFSGGASALLPAPFAPIELSEKQESTRLLLECGATIDEINAVRKHISRLKGGRLARAASPAPVISLVISDVVGDRPDVIASGPAVPDHTYYKDAVAVIEKYGLESRMPRTVMRFLREGEAGRSPETPKPGDPVFSAVHTTIVAGNRDALHAAGEFLRSKGYNALVLTSCMEGEAREAARVLAAVGKEIRLSGQPVSPPCCVLAGGETTVTLRGGGKGGRNQELALSTAISLDGWERISLLCAGTDGSDGPTDAAGAFADGGTCARARALGLDPADYLARNDAYHFFDALGDLLITGPTRTNVMDLVCMIVE